MKAIRRMPAGEFKARCLAVLDDVAASKREIVITKRGRPVARLVPLEPVTKGPLHGLVLFEEDVVAPIDVDWDATR